MAIAVHKQIEAEIEAKRKQRSIAKDGYGLFRGLIQSSVERALTVEGLTTLERAHLTAIADLAGRTRK